MEPIPAVPSGANVLLDANILIYSLSGVSPQCVELVRRCAVEEISGFTTAEIVNEVCHRLMVAEAYAKGFITRPNASSLKGKTNVVRILRDYWTQVLRVLDSNLLILELNESRMRRASRVRDTEGLMTTDSVVLAAALDLGIERLASNDADFRDLPGLTVCRPTDLP